MNVTNFPSYHHNSEPSGYTLFKPGKFLPEGMQQVIDPGIADIAVDSALRKVFPDMPYDPSFVRNNGMLDAINASAEGKASNYQVDLGNLERGRPVIFNANQRVKDDWNNSPDKFKFMQAMMDKQSAYDASLELKRLIPRVFKTR